mmetsp:Transcript_66820/g.164717  ORF Transcript_66820/g.164717 Transcript_66820/m.164717 type:complete len:292 (+) Transcript_66820:1156-2031(+)
MLDTLSGEILPLISVKPTMSLKKMVTHSLYSGSTFLPSTSASAMCLGNTSSRSFSDCALTRLCCLICSIIVSRRSLMSMSLSTSSIRWNVGRSSGSLCQHSSIICAISTGQLCGIAGLFGLCASRGCATSCSTSVMFSPSNGSKREMAWYRMMPNEYTSLPHVAFSPRRISGAIQYGLPVSPSFCFWLRPKSAIFALNDASTRMFCAFRSPCISGGLAACRKRMPWTTSLIMLMTMSLSSTSVSLRIRSSSDPFSISSMHSILHSFVTTTPSTVVMQGCRNLARKRISCTN